MRNSRTRAASAGAPDFKPAEPAQSVKQPAKEVVVSTTVPADVWVQWRMHCLNTRQTAQKLLREMILKTLREAGMIE